MLNKTVFRFLIQLGQWSGLEPWIPIQKSWKCPKKENGEVLRSEEAKEVTRNFCQRNLNFLFILNFLKSLPWSGIQLDIWIWIKWIWICITEKRIVRPVIFFSKMFLIIFFNAIHYRTTFLLFAINELYSMNLLSPFFSSVDKWLYQGTTAGVQGKGGGG